MKWPWRRKVCDGRPSDEARAAMRQVDRLLIDTDRRDAAAKEVAERLRKTTARNHFREAVEQAMRRHA